MVYKVVKEMSLIKKYGKKIARYSIYAVIIVLAEIVLRRLSMMDFLDKDLVPFVSVYNWCYIIAVIIVALGVFTVATTQPKEFNSYVKRHKTIVAVTGAITLFITISRCRSILQDLIYVLEYGLLYLIFDNEICKRYNYILSPNDEKDNSAFTEKPVVGRANLTAKQVKALNELIELLDGRGKSESFNIGLIGSWGCGKSSITNTLVNELENRKELPDQYFFLKISVLTINKATDIVSYIKSYFDLLFRKYEVGCGLIDSKTDFLTFLSLLTETITTKGRIIGIKDEDAFVDLENEKKLFSGHVQNLLTISSHKNIVLIIDDLDRGSEQNINEILRVMLEFSEIEGIITIISLDKSYDIVYRPNSEMTNSESEAKNNRQLEKFIHFRIRVEDDSRIEYNNRITNQINDTYIAPDNNDMYFVSCNTVMKERSLFDAPTNYDTTEIVDTHHHVGGGNNIFSIIFLQNLIKSGDEFGIYFEKLGRDYLEHTQEIAPYIEKLIIEPHQWNDNLKAISILFKWTDAFSTYNYDWINQLYSNASQITFSLFMLIEGLILLAEKDKSEIPDDIVSIEDVYEYMWIEEKGVIKIKWKDRKKENFQMSGLEDAETIVFTSEEKRKIDKIIKEKRYEDAKNIIMEKVEGPLRLLGAAWLLSDFISYFRSVLNNYRTFKIQIREAKFYKMNYLDYLIKEYQPRKEMLDQFEKVKEQYSFMKDISFSFPSLTALINSMTFEKHITHYRKRFSNGELDSSRLFLYQVERDSPIIIITKEDCPIEEGIFLDVTGEEIKDIDQLDLEKMKERNELIWQN